MNVSKHKVAPVAGGYLFLSTFGINLLTLGETGQHYLPNTIVCVLLSTANDSETNNSVFQAILAGFAED